MAEFFFIPDDTVAESFGLAAQSVVPLVLGTREEWSIYFTNTRDGSHLAVSIHPDGLSGTISTNGPITGSRQMSVEFVPTRTDSGVPLIVARPHSNLRKSDPALSNLASFASMLGTVIAKHS